MYPCVFCMQKKKLLLKYTEWTLAYVRFTLIFIFILKFELSQSINANFLLEKCPNKDFQSVFSRIWTKYGHLFRKFLYQSKYGKIGTRKVRIRTLFTQCYVKLCLTYSGISSPIQSVCLFFSFCIFYITIDFFYVLGRIIQSRYCSYKKC